MPLQTVFEAAVRQSRQVLVLGLGNAIASDDGAGVRALERLKNDSRLPPDAVLVDGGTACFELLDVIAGAGRLVILDSVDTGAPPGTLVRMCGAELRGVPRGASAHELGLADLLAASRLLGTEPAEVVLLGIQPASVAPGLALSPAVESALPALVEAALREIGAARACEPT